MGTNRVVVIFLGVICVLLILAIIIISALGHESPPAITNSLSAALGALLAFANPISGHNGD